MSNKGHEVRFNRFFDFVFLD